jgi:hypothetical protein
VRCVRYCERAEPPRYSPLRPEGARESLKARGTPIESTFQSFLIER